MTIIGKLTCAARKLLRLRKVHDMKSAVVFDGEIKVRRCTRCGHTVLVKPRKPRATKQEMAK